jgi:hypothetical protein
MVSNLDLCGGGRAGQRAGLVAPKMRFSVCLRLFVRAKSSPGLIPDGAGDAWAGHPQGVAVSGGSLPVGDEIGKAGVVDLSELGRMG